MTRSDVEFDATAPSSPVIPDALPVCLYLPEDWSNTDSNTSGDGGAGVSPPLQGIPVVDNLSDAVALLPATFPPAAADLRPLAQHATVPQTPTAPRASARTHDYNLRARKGTGEPSALSASAHSTLADGDRDPVPAYAPVTLEAAVAHRDWSADPPQSRAEALSRHDAYLWKTTMDGEYKALVDNDTWTIVQLPRGARHMRGKWVFAYKQDADGQVTRYKARFVRCGYSQQAGVDYNEIRAPCPALATVRAVIAYAAAHEYELDTVDIKTAYLNAPMDVEVYVDLPVGYSGGGPKTVAKLRSALYGTKQAGHLWGEHLCATLTAAGANRSTTDPKLYTWKYPHHGRIIILAHVEDLATLGKTRASVEAAKAAILQRYQGRDLGPAKEFLGMRIVRDRDEPTLTISCPDLIKELIDNFGISSAHRANVPFPAGTALHRSGEPPMDSNGRYQELVGSLLYLATAVRPDIAFAANCLARFMSNPDETH